MSKPGVIAANQFGASAWWSLPLVLVTAFAIYWSLTDTFSWSIDPSVYLPILMAWLAFRFGRRALGLMLLAVLLSCAAVTLDLSPALSVSFGIPVAWIAAAAFAIAWVWRSAELRESEAMARGSHTAVAWLLVTLLLVAVYWRGASATSAALDGGIELRPGGLLFAIACVGVVRWRAALRVLLDGRRRTWPTIGFLVLVVGIATAALASSLRADAEMLRVYFGGRVQELLPIACFIVAATASVRWPALIAVLVAVLLADASIHLEAFGNEPTFGSKPVDFLQFSPLVPWSIAMVLTGAAIAPAWSEGRLPGARSWRIALLLASALAASFASFANAAPSYVIVGFSFAAGLAWGSRAMLGAPVLLMFLQVLASSLLLDFRSALPTQLLEAGAIAFPYALFGAVVARELAARASSDGASP